MIDRRAMMFSATSAALLVGCSRSEAADEAPYSIETVATGLEQPWGMAFLPDGGLLVTEKTGSLRLITDSSARVIGGTPEVLTDGQAGLLDVAVDPDFASNAWVYLSFAEPDGTGKSGTAVLRGKLSGEKLTQTQVIWRQTPKVASSYHWGSRLVFDRSGNLFVTTGERASFSELAQDLSTTLGKTIRIRPDGSIPADNPFVNTPGAKPEIWSYGHRNMQGAFLHPVTGELWTMEHGPQGGDEINLDLAGRNYGWPVITWGIGYDGKPVGQGLTTKEGMEQPLHYWTPSIAPSGMMYYTGDAFPAWKGKLFVGSLKFQYLNMLTLDGNKVVSEQKLLEDQHDRVRDVAQGPDGFIYVAFDNPEASIIRLRPKV